MTFRLRLGTRTETSSRAHNCIILDAILKEGDKSERREERGTMRDIRVVGCASFYMAFGRIADISVMKLRQKLITFLLLFNDLFPPFSFPY